MVYMVKGTGLILTLWCISTDSLMPPPARRSCATFVASPCRKHTNKKAASTLSRPLTRTGFDMTLSINRKFACSPINVLVVALSIAALLSIPSFGQPAQNTSTLDGYIPSFLQGIANQISTAKEIVSLTPALTRFHNELVRELEQFLPTGVDPRPAHIAIIMDGNRRWARQNGYADTSYGHVFGVARLVQLVKAIEKMGIQQATLYAFSMDNWNRSPHEVSVLMSLVDNFYQQGQEHLKESNIRVRHIGKTDRLPDGVQAALQNLIQATRHNTGLTVNLVFNYGATEDLVEACQHLITTQTLITPASLLANLSTGQLPDWSKPDMVIRTSGEQRLSGFLPLENSYAELFFPNTLWPDFTPTELNQLVDAYSRRKRRFGR